ncbi:META and DUF4377 domain-containing protein [Plesiomonas shigelloides]|uniref:META and DUF4377 domain-containing protein n=1 Tax=Plesiomonas shigelloides TaxID=703 RepID=UPI001261C485|nr:META and DUF4377 domain-containing protein [Plesiomonas shigelloides]KAB7685571.1 DUF4377 domain-containing protein [Plesiomonas shigelloides]MCX2532089.1 META and DUF4377 domain-containing protein [Plesiomonas shigelloides]MDT1010049.1 META and DUF4377 domain-containing protein [Plesiomonas shigelloides]
MHLRSLSLITAVALLAGCNTMQNHIENIDGRWQQTNNSADSKPATLDIQQGHLAAFAGCNRMMGAASVENNQLVVKQLAASMMMCEPQAMEREQAFSTFLASRPTISLKDNQLTLTQGDIRYQFSAQPAFAEGVTKFIYVAAERKPCMGVAPQSCLQIREDSNAPWQNYYGAIEGFEPEPGISYRLRIKEFEVANPPADGSSKRWVLDMIVESAVVDAQ